MHEASLGVVICKYGFALRHPNTPAAKAKATEAIDPEFATVVGKDLLAAEEQDELYFETRNVPRDLNKKTLAQLFSDAHHWNIAPERTLPIDESNPTAITHIVSALQPPPNPVGKIDDLYSTIVPYTMQEVARQAIWGQAVETSDEEAQASEGSDYNPKPNPKCQPGAQQGNTTQQAAVHCDVGNADQKAVIQRHLEL